MLRSGTDADERIPDEGRHSGSGRSNAARKPRRRQDLSQKIAALPDLPREELVGKWVAIYGSPPPRGIKRPLLERAIAWHLQGKAHGGHSRQTLRELRSIADAVSGRSQRASASSVPAIDDEWSAPPPSVPILAPGMRLVREWQGRTYVVEVVEEGFVLDGRSYRSLSAIARRITGARWSGPRFFGL